MSTAQSPVKTSTRFALAALAAALLVAAMPATASADYLKRELAGGYGSAIVSDGAGGHFVGGSFFSWNADSTGGGSVLKDLTYSSGAPTNSGALDRAYKMFDGGYAGVNAVLSDGSGGWYVGGNFTRYGKVKTNTLAHINADGSLDTGFSANIPYNGWSSGCGQAGAGVRALALDGSTLYVGGNFDTVNGVARQDLAAVDATTGALVTGFTTDLRRSTSNICYYGARVGVSSLLVDGGNLFAGGSFPSVGGTTNAAYLAKFDKATGAADTTFNNTTALYSGGYGGGSITTVAALAKVGSDLWVGSNRIGGQMAGSSYVASATLLVVNPATKAIDATKTNSAAIAAGSYSSNGTSVDSIVPDGNGHVYVGGAFSSVGSSPNQLSRSNIAEFDISTQKYLSAFNASVTGATSTCWGGNDVSLTQAAAEVTSLVLDGDALLVSGRFQAVGGSPRSGLAAVSSSTGALNADFAPDYQYTSIGCGTGNTNGFATISRVAKSPGGSIFVAGGYDAVGGEQVGGLIHVNADGTRDTAFAPSVAPKSNPNWANGGCYWWCLSGVRKMVKMGNKLYIGGMFDSVGGNTGLNAVAVLNTSDGSLASRQIQGTFGKQTTGVTASSGYVGDASINDIEVDGNTLWFAGDFEYNQSGNKSVNVVAIDTTTDTKTSFTTSPWTAGSETSSGGGTCYDYYGDPYSCGGSPTTTTYPAPSVNSLAVKNGRIYVGANNPSVFNSSRVLTGNDGPKGSNLTDFGLFAMDATTGNPVSGALGQGIRLQQCTGGSGDCWKYGAFAVTFAGDRLFIGGNFNKFGTANATRNGFAEVDPATGNLLSFDLNMTASTLCSGCSAVIANLLAENGSLFVSGNYQTIGGQSRGGIAQLDLTTDTVTDFDPLDGSNFNAPALYADPYDGKLYAAGLRYYPNDTEYPTVGLILEPTLKYSSSPILDQTTFGYMVTLNIRPPAAPTISSPAASSTSNSNSIAFTGGSGSTFECQLDGGDWGACTSPFDVSSLADGSHTFSVRQTDSLGRVSSQKDLTWTVDRTAPTAPDVTMVSPSSFTQGATNSDAAQFTFTVPSDATKVQCQLDSGAWADCTSPKDLTGLADGNHTMKFRSVDAAGNVSDPQNFAWGVYTTAPATPSITSPSGSSTTNTDSVSFTEVSGLTYKCAVDGGTAVDCTNPFDISGLSDGSHTVTVTAVDPVGNESTAATVTFTRDTTAPSAPSLDNVPADGTSAYTASITLAGAGAGEIYECQVNGGGWATCTSPLELSGLVDGPQSVKVRIVDAAGNVSTETDASWFIGTPVSKPVVTSPGANGPSNSGTVEFTTDSNTTTTCSIDGAPPVPCTSPLDISGLPEGEHTVVITATDGDGNTNQSTFTWTVDLTAPDSPGVTGMPADGTTATTANISLSGAGAGDVYECQLNGATWETCATPLSLSGLTDGVQTLKVRIKDAAGNTSSETQVLWRIGDEAPTPPPGQTGSATLSGPGSVVVGPLAKRIFNGPNFNVNTIWPAGAKRVIISNSPVFSRSQSFPVASTAAWNQPVAKAGTFGSRTVYFKYTGDGINTSQVYTTTFNWDRAAPFLNMFAKKHALGYAPDAWKVRFKGGDKGGSGLAKVQIWMKKNGMPQKPPVAGATNVGFVVGFKDVVTVPGKYGPQWARVSDKSGNWSRWYMIK